MPWIVAAIGTGISAYGQIKQGQAQKHQLQEQADNNRINAEEALQEAAEQERNFRVIARKQLGTMTANLSARGVTIEGSGDDILAESARNIELDALGIRTQGQRKAAAFRRGAALNDKQASAAGTLGLLSGVGSLLQGTGQFLKRT